MTFLRSTIVYGFCLALLACGGDSGSKATGDDDSTDETGEQDDDGDSAGGKKDAGGSSMTGSKDAGTIKTPSSNDGGSVTGSKDGGAAPGKDAGKPLVGVDAGSVTKDAGTGITFPNPFPPAPDAGTAPTGMGKPGAKDGPCKDLMLFCFDPIDMFIFNPSDCVTCNGGMGCKGCAIPYAF